MVINLSLLPLCSLCCLPVHSVVSLHILLCLCSFGYLPVRSEVNLFIPHSYREGAKVRGRIRRTAVSFWSVVFTSIEVHDRYHILLFHKVCLICSKDYTVLKESLGKFSMGDGRGLFLMCPCPFCCLAVLSVV